MTIQTFIEKAIQGGWEWTDNPMPYPLELKLQVFRASYKGAAKERIEMRAFLSPEAWKAVGKVEGWDERKQCFNCKGKGFQDTKTLGPVPCDTCDDGFFPLKDWRVNMHRLIHALAEGRSIGQYLETL